MRASRAIGLPRGQICECTPAGGVEPAFWNAAARGNWNRFMQYFRRYYGQTEYACAVEVQKRGLLHFHALVRLTGHNQRLALHYGRRWAGGGRAGGAIPVGVASPAHASQEGSP